jgi:hypothetical protein
VQHLLFRLHHRNHNDLGLRALAFHHLNQLKTIVSPQLQIQQHDIKLMLTNGFSCILEVVRLRDHHGAPIIHDFLCDHHA